MLVYGRDTVLQVIHNREHDFQKIYPVGGTNSNTHMINLGKTKWKPNEASRQRIRKIHKWF